MSEQIDYRRKRADWPDDYTPELHPIFLDPIAQKLPEIISRLRQQLPPRWAYESGIDSFGNNTEKWCVYNPNYSDKEAKAIFINYAQINGLDYFVVATTHEAKNPYHPVTSPTVLHSWGLVVNSQTEQVVHANFNVALQVDDSALPVRLGSDNMELDQRIALVELGKDLNDFTDLRAVELANIVNEAEALIPDLT